MNNAPELLTAKECRDYPGELFQSILNVASGKQATGLVDTVSRSLESFNRDMFSRTDTIKVPLVALAHQRGLSAGVQNQGGYLIGTDLQSLEYLLRAQSVLPALGVRTLQVSGNVSWPRELGEVTFSWLKEGDPVSNTTGSLGAMTLQPHRLSGVTVVTRQLNVQAPSLVDDITTAISRGVMVGFEKAAINGSGIFGEPKGVIGSTGVGSVTLSSATTLANLADFEFQVSNANATPNGWVADPATRKKWRTVVRSTTASRYLWDDSNGLRDNVLGYPAYASNVCPANTAILGDWTRMVWCFFGTGAPVELLIDPYSQKKAEGIEVLCTVYGDIGLLQPAAFCYSNGSTIQ
jgi:HK97 family phage major capsid protein